MLLLLDNYDSFTYNLKDYFQQLGETVVVLRNDEPGAYDPESINFDKLVLSPGPKTPPEAGNMMGLIKATYLHKPILGVCLGHQALGMFFGATLVKAAKPMHGKVSAIDHKGEGVYKGIKKPLNVCRYHSLILDNLEKTDLETTASTAQGECMGFRHRQLPITGIQYHPEAILTENGLDLLHNWLKII
jgi:para-aminobenzoate synthetase component 2